MNNDEAKFILNSYRPNGADAANPVFAKAIEQAKQDPALADWMKRQQTYDQLVARKLASISAPAGLREAILAGGKVSRRPSSPRWTQASWLKWGIAAALCVTIAGWWLKERSHQELNLARFALADLANPSAHEGAHGSEAGTVQAALQDAAKPITRPLPIDFANLARSGCRSITVGGRPVLEICFERQGKTFHCYIARNQDFPSDTSAAKTTILERGTAVAAAWNDGVHQIVVATTAGKQALQALL